jgi:ligand-binding sensor domain-containing protein
MASMINELIARKTQPLTVRTGPGLISRSSEGHVQIALASSANQMTPGVASSNITARVGDLAGSGTVDWLQLDPSTGMLNSTPTSTKVWNISSTAGGIPSGTDVLISQDINGNWWVTTADCGN